MIQMSSVNHFCNSLFSHLKKNIVKLKSISFISSKKQEFTRTNLSLERTLIWIKMEYNI